MDVDYWYKLLKSLHIISMTTWMAGLFYLPRIFVYHSMSQSSQEMETFKTMEIKLLKYIMNPSFILTWLFGIALVAVGNYNLESWLAAKFFIAILLSAFHMYCALLTKVFYSDRNNRNDKFYRVINEIPTILFILIVILVVFKPNF